MAKKLLMRFAGWIDRETLLIASETDLWRFDIGTGTRLRLVALEEGNRVTRSNDGRADPQGGFWIGTMGKSAEARAGAIYRYHRGALRRLYADLTIPNAISFAPDGRSACFADTRQQRIFRVALDAEGWPCDEPQVLVDLAPEGLFPDGAVFDRDGGLWNAQWGAGRVARYRPDGTFDRAIAVPARQSSCPAFGGDGLGTLFVTSAAVDIAGADTAQGCVYAVAAGVTGMAEHRFRT